MGRRHNDLADDRGFTALISAVLQGRVDCARLLVEAGADGSRQDNNGKTALEWAEQLGHTKIAELLRRDSEIAELRKELEAERQMRRETTQSIQTILDAGRTSILDALEFLDSDSDSFDFEDH